jgi:uncharacterized caspase-like protein
MKQGIQKIVKLAEVEGGNAELIFYYAGHGFPDETTKESYLMPVDVSGTNVKEGISLKNLYADLTKFPTKRVTVFLDACFSGGGRNAGLLAARGIKIKPKEESLRGNLIVFSASGGDQTSLPYTEKNHGMFTYFLLKKIQESRGLVSYKDLQDYLQLEVRLSSLKINAKDQIPDLLVSPEIENEWQKWNLKERE